MLKVLMLWKNRRNQYFGTEMNKSIVPPGFLIQNMICADSKTRGSSRAINKNKKRFFFSSILEICF